MRDSGIKVVLTGEGSDEIFAGYPHFRRDLVLYGSDGAATPSRERSCSPSSTPPTACRRACSCRRARPALDSVQRVLGFVPSNLEVVGADRRRAAARRLRRIRADAFPGRDTFRVMLSASTSSASWQAAIR